MLGNWRWTVLRRWLAVLLVVVLGVGVGSCSNPTSSSLGPNPFKVTSTKLSEVTPPPVVQELRQALDSYQPQVKILSPRADEVLQDTQVTVRLQVKDLPIFQNEEFGLGPHLHVILDNQPYLAVYDTREPLILKDLEPGTHTLRVFASRPWHESFKNEGAYAQTSFHLFTKTPTNSPTDQPLLTYSRPKGSYGAEPILLDFYLTNAPLHFVANENADDDILDWQIRCTLNGESFLIDRWEPIYLKGLKPGKNWVQLELLDENGNPVANAFNNTVRLIDYQPGGTDTLSKLTRGELTIAEVRGIVDPDYVPPPPEVPEVLPETTPETIPETTLETPEPSPEADLKDQEPAADQSPATAIPAPDVPLSQPPVEIVPPIEPKESSPSQPSSAPLPPSLTPSPADSSNPLAAPAADQLKAEKIEREAEKIDKAKEAMMEEVRALLEERSLDTSPTGTLELFKSPESEPETLELTPLLPPISTDVPSPLPIFPSPAPPPSPSEPSQLRELFNRSKNFFEQWVKQPVEESSNIPASPIELPEPFIPAPETLSSTT